MCDAGGGRQSAQYSDSYSHCYLLSVLRRREDPGHLSCQQTAAALCTLAQPSSPTVLEHSVLQLLQLSTYDDPASPQTATVVHLRKPLRAQVTSTHRSQWPTSHSGATPLLRGCSRKNIFCQKIFDNFFSFQATEMVLTSKWGRIQPEIQI